MGEHRIRAGSASYPFLAYSREHELDYGDVLTIAEMFAMRPQSPGQNIYWETRHYMALKHIPSSTHQFRIGRLAFLYGKADFCPQDGAEK